VKKLKNLNELLNEAIIILKKIKQNDKICIIYHDDSDGCCSAALFSVLVHDLINDYPLLFPVSGLENVNRTLMNRLRLANPDFVFAFDITVDPEWLEDFNGFVLDHHFFKEISERENMPYLNPRTFENDDEKVPPVCYIVYRILKTMSPSEKISWIPAIGITEDHRVDLCKDVFDEVKNDYPELLNNVEKIEQKIVESAFFGELSDMVRSGRMVRGNEGAKTAVLALVESKDRPDKFVNGLTQHSFALRRFYEKLTYETQNWLNDVERKGRFFKNEKVIFYEQKGMGLKGLTSFLSDKIRQKYPEWIICVINKEHEKGRAKISIRLEQSKRNENLVYIIEEIKKKMPSIRGGGHKSAIGVFLHPDEVPYFEKEFLSLVK